MGVWNATCAISHLPIQEGEACRVLFLAEAIRSHRGSAGFHDTEEIWKPVTLPIRGTYDNYGGVVDLEPAWYLDVVARQLGGLSEEGVDMRPAILVGRIYNEPVLLNLGDEEKIHLGMVFIREDVYQALAEAPFITDYKFVEKDTLLREEKETLATLLANARLAKKVEMLRDLGLTSYTEEETGDVVDVSRQAETLLRGLAQMQMNLAILRDNCPAFEPVRDYMIQNMMEGMSLDDDSVRQGVHEIVNFRVVRLHMEALRRSWMPQPGLGSQTLGWHSNMILLQCVRSVVERGLEETDSVKPL